MNAVTAGPGGDLANKIARLVEERGWNQEDFARISKLNRHTVRQILHGGPKRQLRNATVSQCAKALGLTVSELRNLPARTPSHQDAGEAAGRRRGTQVALRTGGSSRSRQLARAKPRPRGDLRNDEIQELLDMQSPGGPLEKIGVESCVDLIERRRRLVGQVKEIAGTEYLDLLEQLVRLIYEQS